MLQKFTISIFSFFLPFAAFAAQGPDENFGLIGRILQNSMRFIDSTLVPLVFALAFIFFIWGMFRYFIFGGANEESREAGKKLMIWSIVAFVLMVSVWGIVNVITSSINIADPTLDIRPTVSPQ